MPPFDRLVWLVYLAGGKREREGEREREREREREEEGRKAHGWSSKREGGRRFQFHYSRRGDTVSLERRTFFFMTTHMVQWSIMLLAVFS
jgi:hypothetical protein